MQRKIPVILGQTNENVSLLQKYTPLSTNLFSLLRPSVTKIDTLASNNLCALLVPSAPSKIHSSGRPPSGSSGAPDSIMILLSVIEQISDRTKRGQFLRGSF